MDQGTNYICVTCGTQFAESAAPPARCPICDDERQYVGWEGQQWTTMAELGKKHRNVIREEEPGLWGIGTEPSFAIGQRALPVQTLEGDVLWDCISLIDSATVKAVRERGGISAIVISHPHFYAAMVDWSRAFGDAPIYVHAADRRWVQRASPEITYWEGETESIGPGLTLVRVGGHFDGSQVLHWAGGADGSGVLLSGDMPQVCMDRGWVSFMRSYPNFVPLGEAAVRRVVDALEPFEFDRLYGGWFGKVVQRGAKTAVRRSAERYIKWIIG